MMASVVTCDFENSSEIRFEFILTKKQWNKLVESVEYESYAVLKDENEEVEVTLAIYDEFPDFEVVFDKKLKRGEDVEKEGVIDDG